MELERRAVGVVTWRYRGIELWTCAAGMQMWKNGDRAMEASRYAAGEATGSDGGIAAWGSGGSM